MFGVGDVAEAVTTHTGVFKDMCCAAVNCKIVCKICSTVVKKVIKLFIVDSFFSRAANFC